MVTSPPLSLMAHTHFTINYKYTKYFIFAISIQNFCQTCTILWAHKYVEHFYSHTKHSHISLSRRFLSLIFFGTLPCKVPPPTCCKGFPYVSTTIYVQWCCRGPVATSNRWIVVLWTGTAISVVFVMSAFSGLVALLIVPMIPSTKTTHYTNWIFKNLEAAKISHRKHNSK